MSFPESVRPASLSDAGEIKSLLLFKDHVHRHLDWRSPLDWLGKQPYFVLERSGFIQAAMACPDDPPGVSWVRFFASMPQVDRENSWQRLFDAAREYFSGHHISVASVAIHKWYLNLLLQSDFTFLQTIVVLHMNTPTWVQAHTNPEIAIRLIGDEDLKMVTEVDQASFQPLWQNSFHGTSSAFKESTYATIAVHQDKIVGYQMSSSTTINAHLARLAVLPEMQGRGIGTILTKDMVRHYSRMGIGYITVNTQSDNLASIELYKKIGFDFSGERFPVMHYQII